MTFLEGKTAIVTGSSSGIGRAIAEKLARSGASVVVNYAHSTDKAEEVVSTIEVKGGHALAVQADISKTSDVNRLFEQTFNRFGRLDILVNNAGTAIFKPLAEITTEEFDQQFSINTRGTFLAMQKAAQLMSNGGRIVNISTLATANSIANFSIYSGSKAAVEQFAISAAQELGERNITVNVVSPGSIDTKLFNKTAPPNTKDKTAQLSPFNRIGQPTDVADVVVFLVSEQARWITGQNIHVSGGVD